MEDKKVTDSCQCSCKDDNVKALDISLEKHGYDSGNLIGILQDAQEIYGYLPADIIYYIAEKTSTTPARIKGVATFYAQFRLEPVGKYLVMLCKGTACHVNGSDRIEDAVTAYLGIVNGQTTPDGLFTLKNVACLGCCSLSPVMMINEDTFGNLVPDKAVAILKEIQEKEAAK